jgi:hypothetical protein
MKLSVPCACSQHKKRSCSDEISHKEYAQQNLTCLENTITAKNRYRVIVLDIELVTKLWSMEPPRRGEICRPVYQ